MDISYINAFIEAVENVFATMLQTSVQVLEPTLKRDHEPAYAVSGIIGLHGDVVGSVVLSFPTEVAERLTSLFTSMPLDQNHPDLADAIGELVNMISGNAKAKFGNKRCTMSVPTVIIGHGHQVVRIKDAPSILLPCECNCGEFSLEVCLKENSEATVERRVVNAHN